MTDKKLFVFDVDGTLTDGGILISSNGVEVKRFQAKDGLIVRVLPEIGVETLILTGRNSELTQIRAEDLHVSYIFQGVNDKVGILSRFMAENGFSSEQVVFFGDDLNDYTAMMLCKHRVCPSDAAEEIKNICEYVSTYPGGEGAVRDCCEVMLKKFGLYSDFTKLFGV